MEAIQFWYRRHQAEVCKKPWVEANPSGSLPSEGLSFTSLVVLCSTSILLCGIMACALQLSQRSLPTIFSAQLTVFLGSFKHHFPGCPGGSVIEHLPSAQVMILGSWDRVPHRAPHKESASASAYVSASVCVSLE